MNKPDMSLRCSEFAEVRVNSVIRKFRTTASDGKRYNTQFYNLNAIISGIPAQDHFPTRGKWSSSAQARSALSATTISTFHDTPDMLKPQTPTISKTAIQRQR